MKALTTLVGVAQGANELGKVGVGIVQSWASLRVIQEGLRIGDITKKYFGDHFEDLVDENPVLHFLFIASILIFITSFLMSVFYKMFGLKMGKGIRTFVLLAPFLCMASGLFYVGYASYQVSTNYFHSKYAECATLEEVEVMMQENGQTHQSLYEDFKKKRQSYVHEMIKIKMPQVFYESMFKELDKDQVNKKYEQKIVFNAPKEGRISRKLIVRPYLFAAYQGNTDFLRAANKSSKAITATYVTDVETKGKCEGYFPRAYDLKYSIYQTITPFSVAQDNGHTTCMNIIREEMIAVGAEKNGKYCYKGYSLHDKKTCDFGGSKDRTIPGDLARTIFAPFTHSGRWLFGS